MGCLFAGSPTATESMDFEKKWASRFEELSRSEDPAAADAAFETLLLVLSNQFISEANAGLEPTAGLQFLDAAEEWVGKMPDSKRLGIAATFLSSVAQEEPLVTRALALLERLRGSPHPEVKESALLETGRMLLGQGQEEEAMAALRRVVEEFEGTFSAEIASRELRSIGIRPGAEAPDFELADLSGDRVRLSSLRGKAVLLNFWGMG
ncbi:MAG: redoxin domain-containing protein [Planctomycetaceae bacterium]|nr:redoxin domain-containing protein [Planctomycetaceae bacterium]